MVGNQSSSIAVLQYNAWSVAAGLWLYRLTAGFHHARSIRQFMSATVASSAQRRSPPMDGNFARPLSVSDANASIALAGRGDIHRISLRRIWQNPDTERFIGHRNRRSCLSKRTKQKPHYRTSPNFLCTSPVVVARFSSESVAMLCTSGFVDNVNCFHTTGSSLPCVTCTPNR